MENSYFNLSNAEKQKLMREAILLACEKRGMKISKRRGRGRVNVYIIEKGNKTDSVSFRTSQNRWIAFPPLERGSKWKTLSDVAEVFVATVDEKDDPKQIEVYEFPAAEVQKRFDRAYAARVKEGHKLIDDFGMWVCLDKANGAYEAGSGIVEAFPPLAIFPVADLMNERSVPVTSDIRDDVEEDDDSSGAAGDAPLGRGDTPRQQIPEIMALARTQIANAAGVPVKAVKLSLSIDYDAQD